MTAPAIDTAVDPTGLNGERIGRNDAFAPDVTELWSYPSALTYDAIEAAWRKAPRRPRTLVMSILLHRQSGGRLVVRVRLYVEPSEALP